MYVCAHRKSTTIQVPRDTIGRVAGVNSRIWLDKEQRERERESNVAIPVERRKEREGKERDSGAMP